MKPESSRRAASWAAVLLLAISIFQFSRCREARDLEPPSVGVTFAGQVIDENEQPVSGALVEAGDVRAYTNQHGVFRLDPTLVRRDGAVLRVSKTGYFQFVRAYGVEQGMTRTVRVQLLERTNAGQVNPAVGGTVQVGDVTLNFPANAFADLQSSGAVTVYARYLDPAGPDLALHMPGDLRGITAAGDEHVLVTYGMLVVELAAPGNQEIAIAPDKQVEISLPIAAGQLASAPATIPLWWFDTAVGEWREEGSAAKQGDRYVGSVRHFTWWNWDISAPRVNVSGQVFLGNAELPLSYARLRICHPTLGCIYGSADGTGYYFGPVPADAQLELTVLNACNETIYATTIGPFAENTVLPPIIVPPGDPNIPMWVEGTLVDCNQQPLAGAYVVAEGQVTLPVTFTDAQGHFIVYANPQCQPEPTVQLTAYDLVNLNTSPAINLTWQPGGQDLGNVAVCMPADEFIIYSVNGQSYSLLSVWHARWGDTESIISENPGAGNTIVIRYNNPGQPGTYPLIEFYSSAISNIDSSATSNAMSTTITQYGNVGQHIEGTFGGQIEAIGGAYYVFSGSYRVRREQ